MIPALNEEKTIGFLIDSILAPKYKNLEIIVVDGGSTDGTKEIAMAKGAVVLDEKGPVKNPANARNFGAASTDAEILCFLDGDVEKVNVDFFKNALLHFENNNTVAVYVNTEILFDSIFEKKSILDIEYTRKLMQQRSPYAGFPIFLRKDVFAEIGGYPLIGFGEDKILRDNLIKYLCNNTNSKIEFELTSVQYKHGVHSLRDFWKQQVWYGKTLIQYLKKQDVYMKRDILINYLECLFSLSFVSFFLALFSQLFWLISVPFLIYFLKAFIESIKTFNKDPLIFFTLDIISGFAKMMGLLKYLFFS